MYTTLDDFHGDIAKARLLLSMTVLMKDFSGIANAGEKLNSQITPINDSAREDGGGVSVQGEVTDSTEQNDIIDIIEKITSLHSCARSNHSNLTILNGTLLLFIAGRFESFVRETFEELCKNIVEMADKFSHLPKEMKDNLIKYTSDVIANPRKYGHGDNGVKAFVRILSSNLLDDVSLIEVNHQCLSVTYENMRPETLSELFKRVGIKNIWEKISQQSQIQVYFETSEAQNARSQSEKFLNDMMERRNQIAHPSRSITWPDADYITSALAFLEALSSVLISSLNALEYEVQSKVNNARNGSRA